MVSKENKIRGEAEALIRGHLKNPLQRLLFNFVLRNARKSVINRENMRFARTRLFGIVRRLFRRMGELLADKAVLEKASDIYYLTVEEVFGLVQGTAVTIDLRPLVGIRKKEYGEFAGRTLPDRFETQGIPSLNCWDKERVSSPRGKMLRGIKCSAGQAEGRARVIRDPRCPAGEGDYILVAQSTDPGWVFLMIASKGIVVERGSVLSHTAIIGRELGIPTVVGARGATHLIPDGARTFINADTGEVRWL
jgi:pyruvate,water dikinase